MTKVFIDGSAGTTGLRIHQRLSERSDMELILLPEEKRKDPLARSEAMNSADVAFLCLPDGAAMEAAAMAGDKVVLIDTSTAHRTAEGWTYGFPELEGQREKIAASRRIANPGCHASGFIALVQPLIRAGLLERDALLSCFSLTGYSGGGKSMIAQYEAQERSTFLGSPRQYGLNQQHKHLKEMAALTGAEHFPVFCPVVGDFYSGMAVTVPLHRAQLKGSMEDVKKLYANCYSGGLVRYTEQADEDGFIPANAMSGRDDMLITVAGSNDRIILEALYDNLGKGASGAAIQNMNIVLGLDETTGLEMGGKAK